MKLSMESVQTSFGPTPCRGTMQSPLQGKKNSPVLALGGVSPATIVCVSLEPKPDLTAQIHDSTLTKNSTSIPHGITGAGLSIGSHTPRHSTSSGPYRGQANHHVALIWHVRS